MSNVVILWRKMNSTGEFFKKAVVDGRDSTHSLNGLQANTSYEIQVQMTSKSSIGYRSNSAYATTHSGEGGKFFSCMWHFNF